MIWFLMFIRLAVAGDCLGENLQRVPTADGSAICMHRRPGKGPPVLLVHGISSNRHFWDMNEKQSLSLYLNAAGFDVWNMDFRGHGGATRTLNNRKIPRGWTIDDYGEHDLSAAFARISAERPGEKIAYVAHSLGGMALTVHLSKHGDDNLSGVVIVASPLDFGHTDPMLQLAGTGAQWFPFTVPTPFLSRVAALFKKTPFGVDKMILNPTNIDVKTRREMFRKVVSPMTRKELRQVAGMIDEKTFSSADRSRDYKEQLKDVRVPFLFLAGRGDLIAPVDRVLAYHDAIGSKDKTFTIIGRAHGFSADYGHVDYSLGMRVQDEIYPMIRNWIISKSESSP